MENIKLQSFSYTLENPQIYNNEIMDHNFGIYKFEELFFIKCTM